MQLSAFFASVPSALGSQGFRRGPSGPAVLLSVPGPVCRTSSCIGIRSSQASDGSECAGGLAHWGMCPVAFFVVNGAQLGVCVCV